MTTPRHDFEAALRTRRSMHRFREVENLMLGQAWHPILHGDALAWPQPARSAVSATAYPWSRLTSASLVWPTRLVVSPPAGTDLYLKGSTPSRPASFGHLFGPLH